MPGTRNSPDAKPAALRPRVKVWLELDGQYVFGHGLCAMLQAVQETGAIKDAAKSLGKSYRYVWGRIKEAEQACGFPLVETRVGGKESRRSSLTPRAEEMVRDFVALRERMLQVVEDEFATRFVAPRPR